MFNIVVQSCSCSRGWFRFVRFTSIGYRETVVALGKGRFLCPRRPRSKNRPLGDQGSLETLVSEKPVETVRAAFSKWDQWFSSKRPLALQSWHPVCTACDKHVMCRNDPKKHCFSLHERGKITWTKFHFLLVSKSVNADVYRSTCCCYFENKDCALRTGSMRRVWYISRSKILCCC